MFISYTQVSSNEATVPPPHVPGSYILNIEHLEYVSTVLAGGHEGSVIYESALILLY